MSWYRDYDEPWIPQRRRQMVKEGYDVAQICANGHTTNSGHTDFPHHSKKYCHLCGAETTTQCPSCHADIRGRLRGVLVDRYEPPAFCHECGTPYSWTESRLEAARDLAAQLGLDVPELTLLEKSIEELIHDTPRAPAEAVRFRNIVQKAQPWALTAFREILFGIISEGAKRVIWPTT